MDFMSTVQIVSEITGGIVIAGGIIVAIVLYIRARLKKGITEADESIQKDAFEALRTTVGAVKTQNSIQASQITSLTNNNKELTTTVAELKGKVDTLSTIPLDKIEKHMSDTNQILQSIIHLIPTAQLHHTITETTTLKNG